jgi:hypothetical protein
MPFLGSDSFTLRRTNPHTPRPLFHVEQSNTAAGRSPSNGHLINDLDGHRTTAICSHPTADRSGRRSPIAGLTAEQLTRARFSARQSPRQSRGLPRFPRFRRCCGPAAGKNTPAGPPRRKRSDAGVRQPDSDRPPAGRRVNGRRPEGSGRTADGTVSGVSGLLAEYRGPETPLPLCLAASRLGPVGTLPHENPLRPPRAHNLAAVAQRPAQAFAGTPPLTTKKRRIGR